MSTTLHVEDNMSRTLAVEDCAWKLDTRHHGLDTTDVESHLMLDESVPPDVGQVA
jgi:hypothetical protein